jgi:ABC-type sugar transport system ATPase subunit
MALSDRIAVMNQGRLQQYGAPGELYEAPANLFVAGFIGSPPMNLLAGELHTEGGDAQFRGEGIVLDLGRMTGASHSKRCVHLGIRPEEIELTPPAGGTIAGCVEAVEYLGSELVVKARAGTVAISVLVPPTVTLRLGEPIGLGLEAHRVRLFDSETGMLIPRAGEG